MHQLNITRGDNAFKPFDSGRLVEHQRSLAIALSRHDLETVAKAALAPLGMWGYPNLIRNPAGPWEAWASENGTREAHDACWPATFEVEGDDPVALRIVITAHPGQGDNPAVTHAALVLRVIAPTEIVHRRSRPPFFDENQ